MRFYAGFSKFMFKTALSVRQQIMSFWLPMYHFWRDSNCQILIASQKHGRALLGHSGNRLWGMRYRLYSLTIHEIL